jgi:hypothetical protein
MTVGGHSKLVASAVSSLTFHYFTVHYSTPLRTCEAQRRKVLILNTPMRLVVDAPLLTVDIDSQGVVPNP